MGTATNTPEHAREKLQAILTKAHTVMLLSHGDADEIKGRPMARVRIDDDATTYLVTSIDSLKVAELERNPRASLCIQDREGTAMIDAEVRISQDRTLIDELWQDDWKSWFAGGKSDPSIAILVVEPLSATCWDGDLGHGISYLYRKAKSRLTNSPMDVQPGDQLHVDLRARH